MKGVPGKKQAVAMEMSAEDTQISHVTENHTAQRETAPAASMENQYSEQANNPTLYSVSRQASRSPKIQSTSHHTRTLTTQQTSNVTAMIIKATIMDQLARRGRKKYF